MLLNPTRMEYLKITKDYAINPFDRAFTLLGTRHHQQLEAVGRKIEGIEVEKFLDGDETGTLDLLEPDELQAGHWVLTDMKSWGSYALAKFLGISDNNGDYERLHTTLQLNNYKIKVEPLGFPVSRLFIQCTVRDGNTKTAFINGIKDNMYMIPVEILPEDYVREYFLFKSFALLRALARHETPPLCDMSERWNGRRCRGYCEAMEFCPEGRAVNKLPPMEE